MEESRLKMIYFCKMINLFTVLKQVPTVVTMKLWRLICFDNSYYPSKLQLFPHSLLIYMLFAKIETFSLVWLNF